MADAIKTLIALDDGVDAEAVRAALPEGQTEIQIVGLVHGLEETWRILQETTTDLLVVACAGYSDRTLFLVDAAVKQRAERPVVVFCDEPAERLRQPAVRGRRGRHRSLAGAVRPG